MTGPQNFVIYVFQNWPDRKIFSLLTDYRHDKNSYILCKASGLSCYTNFRITHTTHNTRFLPCVNTNTSNNTSQKKPNLVVFRPKIFHKNFKIFQQISKNFKNFLDHHKILNFRSKISSKRGYVLFGVLFAKRSNTHNT